MVFDDDADVKRIYAEALGFCKDPTYLTPQLRSIYLYNELRALSEALEKEAGGCTVVVLPSTDNPDIITATYICTRGIYRGGVFRQEIAVPRLYPFEIPASQFVGSVPYHPYVHPFGTFDLSSYLRSLRPFVESAVGAIVMFSRDMLTTTVDSITCYHNDVPFSNLNAAAFAASDPTTFIAKAHRSAKASKSHGLGVPVRKMCVPANTPGSGGLHAECNSVAPPSSASGVAARHMQSQRSMPSGKAGKSDSKGKAESALPPTVGALGPPSNQEMEAREEASAHTWLDEECTRAEQAEALAEVRERAGMTKTRTVKAAMSATGGARKPLPNALDRLLAGKDM